MVICVKIINVILYLYSIILCISLRNNQSYKSLKTYNNNNKIKTLKVTKNPNLEGYIKNRYSTILMDSWSAGEITVSTDKKKCLHVKRNGRIEKCMYII